MKNIVLIAALLCSSIGFSGNGTSIGIVISDEFQSQIAVTSLEMGEIILAHEQKEKILLVNYPLTPVEILSHRQVIATDDDGNLIELVVDD